MFTSDCSIPSLSVSIDKSGSSGISYYAFKLNNSLNKDNWETSLLVSKEVFNENFINPYIDQDIHIPYDNVRFLLKTRIKGIKNNDSLIESILGGFTVEQLRTIEKNLQKLNFLLNKKNKHSHEDLLLFADDFYNSKKYLESLTVQSPFAEKNNKEENLKIPRVSLFGNRSGIIHKLLKNGDTNFELASFSIFSSLNRNNIHKNKKETNLEMMFKVILSEIAKNGNESLFDGKFKDIFTPEDVNVGNRASHYREVKFNMGFSPLCKRFLNDLTISFHPKIDLEEDTLTFLCNSSSGEDYEREFEISFEKYSTGGFKSPKLIVEEKKLHISNNIDEFFFNNVEDILFTWSSNFLKFESKKALDAFDLSNLQQLGFVETEERNKEFEISMSSDGFLEKIS